MQVRRQLPDKPGVEQLMGAVPGQRLEAFEPSTKIDYVLQARHSMRRVKCMQLWGHLNQQFRRQVGLSRPDVVGFRFAMVVLQITLVEI
jgi:hypothetical protein